MRAIRELIGGLSFALITTCTVVGGILLAFTETGLSFAPPTVIVIVTNTVAATVVPLTATLPATFTATIPPSPTEPPTLRPTLPASATIAATATHTPTEPPAASPTFTITVTLGSPTKAPTNTATIQASPTPCGPPPTWVQYRVVAGDTLFSLSLRFGVKLQTLQLANCLPNTNIQAGQIIFVPFVPPTATPTATETVIPSPTPIPEPLQILSIQLLNADLDPSRPNGAIGYVRVDITGGIAPYTIYNDDVPQASNPMGIQTECNGTMVHSVRVVSADGQTATDGYYFSPVNCPQPTSAP